MEKTNQFIYAFMYNDCIYESTWATMSLHFTRQGAKEAMEKHKIKSKKQHDKTVGNETVGNNTFGQFQDWRIKKIKILP
jgi:hypothetical protein